MVGRFIIFSLVIVLCILLKASVALLIITSNSMNPAITAGDTVLVLKKRSYIKGEIIALYTNKHTLVTHRVISIQESLYITKGDANSSPDSYSTTISKIRGKVVIIIPTSFLIHARSHG